MILYRTYYTVWYTECPEYPPEGAVRAACLPADSPWRRMGAAMERFDEGRRHVE